jgi:uncharacterized phage protein (TIGR01671 family)
MSREILFRGKQICNGEWIEGTLYQIAANLPPFIMLADSNAESHEVIRETVGQFTGLIDKNGKKIFEGDICTYPDGWVDYAGDGVETFSIGVVAWDEKNPSFYLTNNIGVEWDEIWDAVDEITVIGNIHDNPELLEVGA